MIYYQGLLLKLGFIAGILSGGLLPSSFAAEDDSSEFDMSAPWFGAMPTIKKYEVHRRGWDTCLRCGGSERLGVVVDVGNLTELTKEGVSEIIDAVRGHGMIVIKSQNLTRAQQVDLTSMLGETVILPSSFEGKDPEPDQPAIQRITNFWANDTWKGPTTFGGHWHQDGQFWSSPKHNILSILHAQKVPPEGGETGFADLRAAMATLSTPLIERSKNVSIHASVRKIKDFQNGREEDYALFPDAVHHLLAYHSLDGGPMLYLGSPHMTVNGLGTLEDGRKHLDMLFRHATSPSFTYFHSWDVGDVIIWDNTQTLHHAMPYNNDGSHKREFYRTQSRFILGPGDDVHHDEL